jgi:hypothetical protein
LRGRKAPHFSLRNFPLNQQTNRLRDELTLAAFPHKGEAHCAERRGTDAEAGPAAGSRTREPPGTGFNIRLRAFPIDGRIVLLPPDPANADGERSNKDR